MQKINRDALIQKANELLTNGTVTRVLGWKKGEFSYDVTPAIFTSVEDMNANFVFDDFAGANFSKYLVKETRKEEGKVLVFLKPCDTYSFNQLLTEHRFDREKVYAVGIPCDGMVDINAIKLALGDGIVSVNTDTDTLKVETLYDGTKEIAKADVLLERCKNCKSKNHKKGDNPLFCCLNKKLSKKLQQYSNG